MGFHRNLEGQDLHPPSRYRVRAAADFVAGDIVTLTSLTNQDSLGNTVDTELLAMAGLGGNLTNIRVHGIIESDLAEDQVGYAITLGVATNVTLPNMTDPGDPLYIDIVTGVLTRDSQTGGSDNIPFGVALNAMDALFVLGIGAGGGGGAAGLPQSVFEFKGFFNPNTSDYPGPTVPAGVGVENGDYWIVITDEDGSVSNVPLIFQNLRRGDLIFLVDDTDLVSDDSYTTNTSIDPTLINFLVNGRDYKGELDPAAGFPVQATDATIQNIDVRRGDFWVINANGTLNSVDVSNGDVVIALVDLTPTSAVDPDNYLIQRQFNTGSSIDLTGGEISTSADIIPAVTASTNAPLLPDGTVQSQLDNVSDRVNDLDFVDLEDTPSNLNGTIDSPMNGAHLEVRGTELVLVPPPLQAPVGNIIDRVHDMPIRRFENGQIILAEFDPVYSNRWLRTADPNLFAISLPWNIENDGIIIQVINPSEFPDMAAVDVTAITAISTTNGTVFLPSGTPTIDNNTLTVNINQRLIDGNTDFINDPTDFVINFSTVNNAGNIIETVDGAPSAEDLVVNYLAPDIFFESISIPFRSFRSAAATNVTVTISDRGGSDSGAGVDLINPRLVVTGPDGSTTSIPTPAYGAEIISPIDVYHDNIFIRTLADSVTLTRPSTVDPSQASISGIDIDMLEVAVLGNFHYDILSVVLDQNSRPTTTDTFDSVNNGFTSVGETLNIDLTPPLPILNLPPGQYSRWIGFSQRHLGTRTPTIIDITGVEIAISIPDSELVDVGLPGHEEAYIFYRITAHEGPTSPALGIRIEV